MCDYAHVCLYSWDSPPSTSTSPETKGVLAEFDLESLKLFVWIVLSGGGGGLKGTLSIHRRLLGS